MSRIGWEGPLIRQTLFLLFLVSISGCAGSLPPAYVNTAQFIDDRPSPKQTSALQLEVKAFENQLQDRTKVGTKRVGVNEINGPLLATQDVSSVTQKSVMTQLRLKGITIGPSPLQMAGVVHDFFVDVDVDPASGRGKFRSTVRADLTVMYTGSQQQIWHKTYTGRATSSGSSVLDSTYEKALRIAFTNLMNQIRQDDSILELQHTYHYAPPQDISKSRPLVMPPPSPPATPPETTPRDTTPPQVVLLTPKLHNGATPITTTAATLPLTGLASDESEVAEVQIAGRTIFTTPASSQELRAAGLYGNGVKFNDSIRLDPGINRLEIQVVDRSGNLTRKVLTVDRQRDTTPPQVMLRTPPIVRARVIKTTKPELPIEGFATDESGIAEVQIQGNTAYMTKATVEELQESGLTGKGVQFAGYTEELKIGTNQITIKAIDSEGNAAEMVLTIERQEKVRPKLDTKKLYDKSVAVVIGINGYEHWPRLRYAINDAKEMHKTLQTVGFDEVLELADKEATRARILQLLGTELPKRVGPNDRVLIFFAGHGATQVLPGGHEMGFLIPVDGAEQDILQTAISMEELRNVSKRIPAKHIFYAIDACYSGLLLHQRGTTTLRDVDDDSFDKDTFKYAEKLTAKPVIQVVTAGHKDEQVKEEGGQGLFTRYLIRGLRGDADMDNDGLITATELGYYVTRQVSAASDKEHIPQYGSIDGEGEVVFIYGQR